MSEKDPTEPPEETALTPAAEEPQSIVISDEEAGELWSEKLLRLGSRDIAAIFASVAGTMGATGLAFLIGAHPILTVVIGLLGFWGGRSGVYKVWERAEEAADRGHFREEGRFARELKLLVGWARRSGFALEVDADEEAARISFMGDAHPGLYRAEHETTDCNPLIEEVENTRPDFRLHLDIELREAGYGVRLRVELPDAWERALRPCVGAHPAALQEWQPSAPFRGEEAQHIRPFVWDRLGEGEPKTRKTLMAEPFWTVVMARELAPWGIMRAYWDEDDLLCLRCDADLASIKSTLTTLTHLSWRLHDTMCQLGVPLLSLLLREIEELQGAQMSGDPWMNGFIEELGFILGERIQLEEKAWQYLRCWYTYLVVKCLEPDRMLRILGADHHVAEEALHALLWSRMAPVLPLLIDDLRAFDDFDKPEDSHEEHLLDLLWDFIKGDWKKGLADYMEARGEPTHTCFVDDVPGAKEALPSLRYIHPAEGGVIREALWLATLAKYNSHERMRLLYDALLTDMAQPSSNGVSFDYYVKERVVETTEHLRLEALHLWADDPEIFHTDLLRWLRTLGNEDFKVAALGLVKRFKMTGPEAEDTVLSQLERTTSQPAKAQEVRWLAALNLLQELGTARSIAPVQEAMVAWEGGEAQVVYERAERLVKKLRTDAEAFVGALSPSDALAEEGQLSLTDDEHKEGQLSLSEGPEKPT